MMFRKQISIHVGALLLAIAAGCDGDKGTAPVEPAGMAELRASLEAFTSFDLAKNSGYNTALTDCMSNGDEGAMGFHFANTIFVDGTADAVHPEVLIYEPGTSGAMSLVGVEFVVPFAFVPKTAPAPTLFGQKFSSNDVFGVWALHVWTHRSNPGGLFASWNVRVHC
jgi:hypothetical protein